MSNSLNNSASSGKRKRGQSRLPGSGRVSGSGRSAGSKNKKGRNIRGVDETSLIKNLKDTKDYELPVNAPFYLPGEKKKLDGMFNTIKFISKTQYVDWDDYVHDILPVLVDLINFKIYNKAGYVIKFHINVDCFFEREYLMDDKEVETFKQFSTEDIQIFDQFTMYKEELENKLEQLNKVIEEFSENGSGWKLIDIPSTEVYFMFYHIQGGGNWIKTPPHVVKSQYSWNPKTNDNMCFMWCLLLYHYGNTLKRNHQRVERLRKYIEPTDREYEEALDPKFKWVGEDGRGLKFPIQLHDISLFEELNPDYAINVFGHEKSGERVRHRVSKAYHRRHQISLLLLSDKDDSPETNFHYCYIHDLDRFLGTKGSHKVYYCFYDFIHFYSKEKLEEHQKHFCQHKEVTLKFKDQDDAYLEFTKFQAQLQTPYFIVADLESLNIKVDTCICCKELVVSNSISYHSNQENYPFKVCKKCFDNHFQDLELIRLKFAYNTKLLEEKNTITTHEQRACSNGFYVVNTFDTSKNSFVQIDCAKNDQDLDNTGLRFVTKLLETAEQLVNNVYDSNTSMELTEEQEEKHKSSTKCHICGVGFTSEEMQQKNWYRKLKAQILERVKDVEFAQKLLEIKKVRDHCHITGEFRGSAHNCCNLNFKYKGGRWKVPVFFHNMKGYDGHFILQWMQKQVEGKVAAIPLNKEKMLTMTTKYLRIIDSFSFFASSLEKLTDNLMGRDEGLKAQIKSLKEQQQYLESIKEIVHDVNDISPILKSTIDKLEAQWNVNEVEGKQRFKFLLQEWERDLKHKVKPEHYEEAFNLLLEKGNWPYEWFTSVEQLKQDHLPPPEAYNLHSALKEGETEWKYTTISPEEYKKEQRKWELFQMQSMQDAHDLYLKLDILLLADICENRRSLMKKDYGLDYTWYVSLPGFSWDVLLRTPFETGLIYNGEKEIRQIKLDLFSNVQPDMYLFINKSIRGGICMTPHRYAKANNKYLPDYNPQEKSQYILYNDATQLYSWAMRQYLPYSEFDWVTEDTMRTPLNMFTEEFIRNYDTDEKNPAIEGFILEVDLDYPEEKHDEHSDYPLAPEPITIKFRELSEYSQQLKHTQELNYSPVEKLCTTLRNKRNYVTHYRNLQLYLKHGLKLKQIHRILKFKQYPWIRAFIDMNVAKRQKATNDFDKDLYKLINNAAFGKTMEDEMNRIDFELVNDLKTYNKKVSSPNFKEVYPIAHNDNLVGILMKKTTSYLTKPKTAGFSILDLSKTLMYTYYYEALKPTYGNKMHLLMTDTDSLETVIETDDLYKDLNDNPVTPYLDFSNYQLPVKPGFSIISEDYFIRFQNYFKSLHDSLNQTANNSCTVILNEVNKELLWYIDDRHSKEFKHIPTEIKDDVLLPPTVLLYGKNPLNKKVTGKFKDESEGLLIKEGVFLRPKCYSNVLEDGVVSNKAKGVPKAMLKKKYITHDDYKDAVFKNKVTSITFQKLTSSNHRMLVQQKTMIALSGFDTKRWVLNDNIHTRAFGHKENIPYTLIKQEEEVKVGKFKDEFKVENSESLLRPMTYLNCAEAMIYPRPAANVYCSQPNYNCLLEHNSNNPGLFELEGTCISSSPMDIETNTNNINTVIPTTVDNENLLPEASPVLIRSNGVTSNICARCHRVCMNNHNYCWECEVQMYFEQEQFKSLSYYNNKRV